MIEPSVLVGGCTSLRAITDGISDAELAGASLVLGSDSSSGFYFAVFFDSHDAKHAGEYAATYRLNYLREYLGWRTHWFQAGTSIGFPLSGHVDISNGQPQSVDYSSSDLRITLGIWTAARIPISGALACLLQADLDLTGRPVQKLSIVTSESSPEPIGTLGLANGPVLIARLGLSYGWDIGEW